MQPIFFKFRKSDLSMHHLSFERYKHKLSLLRILACYTNVSTGKFEDKKFGIGVTDE